MRLALPRKNEAAEERRALTARLVAMNDAALASWARGEPELVVARCALGVRDMLRASGHGAAASRRFGAAIAGLRAGMRRGDVARVRRAWMRLREGDRERLMVEYPGVVGPLNGVPFGARVRANSLVVVAALELLERRARVEGRRGAEENRHWLARLAGRLRWWLEPAFVRQRRRDLSRMLPGFRHAVEHQHPARRLLLASMAGAGRFIALDGELTPATRAVTVFVPGTMTDGNSLYTNMQRLEAVDGREVSATAYAGVYWGGGEFPRILTDNAKPRYAVGLRRRLAAFDAALDLECSAAGEGRHIRQVYVGHSFGGSAIGSAEMAGIGLTADVVVYAGAPGAGYGVAKPSDTVNPGIPRYALVAEGDLKPVAGHLLYGKTMGAAPLTSMGVQRLSTGFLTHALREGRLRLHDDYLHQGSTSALNIRAVVTGAPVLPWLGKGGSDEELAAKIDAAGVPW